MVLGSDLVCLQGLWRLQDQAGCLHGGPVAATVNRETVLLLSLLSFAGLDWLAEGPSVHVKLAL